MATEPSNISLGDDPTHIANEVAASTESQSQDITCSNELADLALSPAREPASTSSVQASSSRPLWKSREGKIAGFKRMIEKSHRPEQRANYNALIRYYQDGGKVPQGQEEVWAVDGQASFGIRRYIDVDQMPEGWLYKHKYCDTSSICQLNYVPGPNEYAIADSEGRVILEDN